MSIWLEASRKCNLAPADAGEHAIQWRVDIQALSEDESSGETVGRILADELRRFDIAERGESVWSAADADSSGLEAAWAALLDERGEFREEAFEGAVESVVYLYRYQLHDDFREWRLAGLDAFCRIFGADAAVLAQHHTTWLSEAEFKLLGFRLLPEPQFEAPPGFPNIDRRTRFMVRDNACQVVFGLSDYPTDAAAGKREHADWLEQQGSWEGLV